MIEFVHRITSGLALVAVVILLIWAIRTLPKGHPSRLGAMLSMVFIIIEALVGAILVLFALVANDTSTARAVVIALHLMNTFLLLGSLTLTAWWASGGQPIQLRNQGWLGWALVAGLLGLLLLGASGAVTALGDTLFPATSLADGLQQESSQTAHFLVRLRVLHPLLATLIGIYLIIISNVFVTRRPSILVRRLARIFTVIYLFQFAMGALNVVLLAPIWMQLVHLFLSDLVLVVWVLFMAAALDRNAVSLKSSPSKRPERILEPGKEAIGQSSR
jgi:heme A synthase